jgi:hypothetical protein
MVVAELARVPAKRLLIPKSGDFGYWLVRHSDFVIDSSFGLRDSGFHP